MKTEDIFKNNRGQFDDEELPDGFAERFEKKLDAKCKHRKRVRTAVYVSSIAASVAILVGLTFLFDRDIRIDMVVDQNIAEVNISVDTTAVAVEEGQCGGSVETRAIAMIDNVEISDSKVEVEEMDVFYRYDPEVEEVISYYQGQLDKMVFGIEDEGCLEIEDEALDSLRLNPISPQELSFMPIEEQLAVVVSVYTNKIRVAEQLSMLCENIDN